jgi:hypothetical protein
MKSALVLTLFMSLMPLAHSASYCLGQSYNQSYDFGTNYAVRCGREKELRDFGHKKKKEIISELAAEGINFVRTIGPKGAEHDIYKIGKVEKDEAKDTKLVFRFVGKDGWGKVLLETIHVWTGKSVIRYDAQKGTASDYRHVNEILNELGLSKVGVVNSIDPKNGATRNVANEVLIVKTAKD